MLTTKEKEWIDMHMDELLREIALQNRWEESLQKDFIEACLKAQGNFKKVKQEDVEYIHKAFIKKSLNDESIQYYVRIYLEEAYDFD